MVLTLMSSLLLLSSGSNIKTIGDTSGELTTLLFKSSIKYCTIAIDYLFKVVVEI